MGIGIDEREFLQFAKDAGADFTRLCTVGRQELTVAGLSLKEYADDFFARLGARTVEVLDYSGYQGATLVHDLNSEDLPPGGGRFTFLLDSGSLEHVFHVPNALRSLMALVEPHGHLAFISPTDGHSGHGFYQFSPEFFFRTLSEANGFRLTACLYRERGRRGWYSVPDPAAVGGRVEINARTSGYLYVLAQRVSSGEPFRTPPLQSDYQVAWSDPSGDRRTRLDRLPPRTRPAVLGLKASLQIVRRPWVRPRSAGLARVRLEGGRIVAWN